MKIKFQADANLDPDIWRGLCRREPSIDFEGQMGVIPDGASDPEVLKLAAEAVRSLDPSRFGHPAGRLPATRMAEVDAALRLVFSL